MLDDLGTELYGVGLGAVWAQRTRKPSAVRGGGSAGPEPLTALRVQPGAQNSRGVELRREENELAAHKIQRADSGPGRQIEALETGGRDRHSAPMIGCSGSAK